MTEPAFDRSAVARRLAPKLRAELLSPTGPSPARLDSWISQALHAIKTGAQIQDLRGSDVFIRLSSMVDAEARDVLSPSARFNRAEAERYAASHEPAQRATPTAVAIGPDYAEQYARAHDIDLAAGRSHFTRLAKNESAAAIRKAVLGEDAGATARRAAHFAALAGEDVDPDIRTLSRGEAPRASDFG